jgi:hypothetical protein
VVTAGISCVAQDPFIQSEKCGSDVFRTSCCPKYRDICTQYIMRQTDKITLSREI